MDDGKNGMGQAMDHAVEGWKGGAVGTSRTRSSPEATRTHVTGRGDQAFSDTGYFSVA
jgi:hypothetical protein